MPHSAHFLRTFGAFAFFLTTCFSWSADLIPVDPEHWQRCEASLLSKHQRDRSQLNNLLRQKLSQRFLFAGSPLLQPDALLIVKPDFALEERANTRLQSLHQESMNNPKAWWFGVKGVTFPKPRPAITVSSILSEKLSAAPIADIAELFHENKLQLPLVFKTNYSVLGSGIAFLSNSSDDSGELLLRFPFSENEKQVGPFHRYPEARSFLRSLDDRFAVDSGTGTAELRLNRKDSNFVGQLTKFFHFLSLDEAGFYDPGFFESRFDLVTFEGRAFESRFVLAVDSTSGEIFRSATPKFLRLAGMSSANGLFEAAYSKIGASAELANIGGRESQGARVLDSANLFEPLIRYSGRLKVQEAAFRAQVNQWVESSALMVVGRLRAQLPMAPQVAPLIHFEIDVGWVIDPLSPWGFSPRLIEAHITLI